MTKGYDGDSKGVLLAFCWVTRMEKILTIDYLKKGGHILVNGCPLCLNAKETTNHLLNHCKFASKVWETILNKLGMHWVMAIGSFFSSGG